jgi:excisionase family DNA binding protein
MDTYRRRVPPAAAAKTSHDPETCIFCNAAQGAELASDPTAELAAMVAALIMPLLEQIAAQQRRLLTVTQAAEQLGISRRYLYHLIYAGELTTIRLPSKTGAEGEHRIEQATVDDFIAQHRVNSPATIGGAR